eukprot:5922438-Alexandrium_andersonii.AAC.1
MPPNVEQERTRSCRAGQATRGGVRAGARSERAPMLSLRKAARGCGGCGGSFGTGGSALVCSSARVRARA